MQVRSVFLASFLHGAVLVGFGLGVRAYVAPPMRAAEISILPSEPMLELPPPEPLELIPVDVEDSEETTFTESEVAPLPLPLAPEPEPLVDDAEVVFVTPTRLPPSQDLLRKTRKQPEPAREPVVVPSESMAAESAPLVEAVALSDQNPPPDYPRLARRLGVEGEVVLLVTVGVDGSVVRVDIDKSAGLTAAHKSLNRAAIAALVQWRYAPARRDDKAVETVIRVPVRFQLR